MCNTTKEDGQIISYSSYGLGSSINLGSRLASRYGLRLSSMMRMGQLILTLEKSRVSPEGLSQSGQSFWVR